MKVVKQKALQVRRAFFMQVFLLNRAPINWQFSYWLLF